MNGALAMSDMSMPPNGFSDLPKTVRITEVCPRDGFQNVKEFIPTPLKVDIVDRLMKAGVRRMEITSFVHPKAIPQMADAAEVVARAKAGGTPIELVALTPNLKGVQRAAECGLDTVSYVISVSEAHNKANINRTVQESLAELAEIRNAFPAIKIILSAATVFGCPFNGQTPVDNVLRLLQDALELGVDSVTLCDTIGVANPLQTMDVVRTVKRRFPSLDIGLHMHNTHGMALANMFAGFILGVDRFETACGGLGGCPFAPGAAGNAATEDAVNMFHRMGVETGLRLEGLLDAVSALKKSVDPCGSSCLSAARTYSEFEFYRPASQ